MRAAHLLVCFFDVHSKPPDAALESFSNDDCDSSEKGKKIIIIIIALLSKTKTLHVDHAFLYISLPSQHDCDAKMPNLTFYGRRKQATGNFSSSFQLDDL